LYNKGLGTINKKFGILPRVPSFFVSTYILGEVI